MSEASTCAYCGCPQPAEEATRRPVDGYGHAMDALFGEVRRIRAIAEGDGADADRRRVEELTREVHHLRETVARLRGASDPAAMPLPRP